jgi:hypothetical protein
VAAVALLGLAACGAASSSANTAVSVATTSAAAAPASAATSAQTAPDVPISQAQTPPHITGGVTYQASLVRPLILVTVPGDGWGAQQYPNKPVYNADFVLHSELGDNPDGVISFVGNLDAASPTSPSAWIDGARSLGNQVLQPRTAGTIAQGVPSVEYEADIVGGPFISDPEFNFPAGWRMHLLAVAVSGKTMAIAYAAPKAKFAAFATTARSVLAALRFAELAH